MAQAAKHLRKNKDLEAQLEAERKEKEEEKSRKRNRSRDRKRKVMGLRRVWGGVRSGYRDAYIFMQGCRGTVCAEWGMQTSTRAAKSHTGTRTHARTHTARAP